MARSFPLAPAGILREKHVAQLGQGEESRLQIAFEYSDGLGAVLVKKIQAEPAAAADPLRWIASGKTILNNKGKPVKQYEPYFCRPETGHRYDAEESEHEEGVTPVMYYDAPGRLVRTEAPDGSYSRVEFSPWHVASYDPNDTAFDPNPAKCSDWYQRRTDPAHRRFPEFDSPENSRAAKLVKPHSNTPASTILDSLGREVISIAHNRVEDAAGAVDFDGKRYRDEKYFTFTKLDVEGKPLWIRDARGNLVMQYIYVEPPKPTRRADEPDPANPEAIPTGAVPCYDIAGNLLFQHSMDAGDRWTLNDAAAKMLFAWDRNERRDATGLVPEERLYFTNYDALHRPLEVWLTINQATQHLIERFVYGESLPDASTRNLRGQLHQHYDSSGLQQVERIDFKGKPVEVRRQLAAAVTAPIIDWQPGSPTAGLEAETFTQISEYDALGRMTRLHNWHRGAGHRVAVYEPTYNARGLLEGEEIVVRATRTDQGYIEERGAQRTQALKAIAYNAKGQKERVDYGNDTITRYDYDPETFRLRQLSTARPGYYNPRFPEYRSILRDPRVLQQLHYTYDPAGNIAEVYDEAYEPVFFQNQQVEARSRYTYDALYRLIEASGRENGAASGPPPQIEPPQPASFPITNPQALRNYQQSYRYDAVGNIEEMHHEDGPIGTWTQHYAYAADSNRLLETWHGNNRAAGVTYRYDTHGNMLNLAEVAARQELRWDHNDLIQALDLVGGGWAYYNYDAGKQRSRKRLERQGDTVEERLYLGGLEIYRKSIGGKLVEEIETLHLFEGQQRALLVDDVLQTDNARLSAGPRYRYQYSNHLGSAVVELDDQSEIISYEEYHPYGTSAFVAMNQTIEAPAKRYRYTGKERDEESGLYYHGARYYAPWLGRWVSCDPVGLRSGANLFQFCRNSPIMLVDLDGRQDQQSQIHQSRPKFDPGISTVGSQSYYDRPQEIRLEDAADIHPGTSKMIQGSILIGGAAIALAFGPASLLVGGAAVFAIATGVPIFSLGAIQRTMALSQGQNEGIDQSASVLGAMSTPTGFVAANAAALAGGGVEEFVTFGELGNLAELGWALGSASVRIVDLVKKGRLSGNGFTGVGEIVEKDLEAEKLYERIRNRSQPQIGSEIASINTLTGMDEKVIRAARQHLFLDNHSIRGGLQHFDADRGIADDWLMAGNEAKWSQLSREEINYLRTNMQGLIRHEYGEQGLVKFCRLAWRDDGNPNVSAHHLAAKPGIEPFGHYNKPGGPQVELSQITEAELEALLELTHQLR